MKKQGGLNFEFLNKFQNRLDDEAETIAIQLHEKLESIGNIIKQETGIVPISSEFITWYLDNHYKPKKRRLPLKLTNELILKYCFEYKEELERKSREFKPEVDYNLKLTNNIEEILSYDFRNDTKLTKENYEELKLNLLYILTNQEVPKKYTVLETNEVSLGNDYIRYCFYQIYLLDKKTLIRKLIVHFLYLKFKVFHKPDFDIEYITEYTEYKKFSKKPQYYPE